jgi:polysaccharide biosynthesis protein PslH
MKTLFVAPQVPWPLDAGSKIRLYQLVSCYATISKVTLVCFAQDDNESAVIGHLQSRCEHVWSVPYAAVAAHKPTRGRIGALRSLVQPVPRIVRAFRSEHMAQHLRRVLDEQMFDIVHIGRLSMTGNVAPARLKPKHPRPYWILDIDDVESWKARRSASVEGWTSARKYAHLLESVKLALHERHIVRQFDCTLVCSDVDRARLRAAGGHVEVFPNGADTQTTVQPCVDDGRTLLYLGAMGYAPNDDAALFFIQQVLPLVRQRVPDARVVIAGKSPSERLRAFGNDRDIIVTGFVPDKDPVLRACSVFIVPLRMGGGTRIKILEAMSFGRPVVSTTVGYEGIDAIPGEHLLVGDTPQQFADACVMLLINRERRIQIGWAGRALLEQNYDWHAIRSAYVRSLEQRLRDRR